MALLLGNTVRFTEQQKRVFENHVRIEDTHLDEAKAWEKKVEWNRAKAARKWRAKMHCMQTIAEGRMADIERRKYDRKRNAAERQAAKVTFEVFDFVFKSINTYLSKREVNMCLMLSCLMSCM